MTRITQRMLSQSTLANLQGSLARTANIQERLASGRVLNRPSDDPTALVTAMQTRGALAQQKTNLRAADNGVSWLNTADSALQGASNILHRVRDLLIQGANDTIDQTARNNIAAEIEALRAGLLEAANTSFAGRNLFAGTADGPVAFDPSGTYAGDQGVVERTIAPGQRVQVNLIGSDVFGDGPDSIFAILQGIADDLRTNPSGLVATHLPALDDGRGRILAALGEVGARTNRIESTKDRGTAQELTLMTRLSETESTDLTATIMELQLQEVAYQSALAATARVLQPSLLDFLR